MGALLRRCSGDPNDAFARGTGGFQRGRVVHGMLVASLFPALITSHAPGAMYASQSLKFAAPVHVRDEVVAQVQALHIKATGARHILAVKKRKPRTPTSLGAPECLLSLHGQLQEGLQHQAGLHGWQGRW
ncbi:uncharacterized protein LOC119317080 [Triticum dicoccoides]|uniref:uncharacterized protein LOC119317080 n=1 Tax=Triticum dicoccoides TaxID=85692 RepID=UPI0018917A12|nr:uncharacterized protein LOC119317080 [Triticum dicoccoides]